MSIDFDSEDALFGDLGHLMGETIQDAFILTNNRGCSLSTYKGHVKRIIQSLRQILGILDDMIEQRERAEESLTNQLTEQEELVYEIPTVCSVSQDASTSTETGE